MTTLYNFLSTKLLRADSWDEYFGFNLARRLGTLRTKNKNTRSTLHPNGLQQLDHPGWANCAAIRHYSATIIMGSPDD